MSSHTSTHGNYTGLCRTWCITSHWLATGTPTNECSSCWCLEIDLVTDVTKTPTNFNKVLARGEIEAIASNISMDMDSDMVADLNVVLVEKLIAKDQTSIMVHLDGLNLWQHAVLKLHLEQLNIIVCAKSIWMCLAYDGWLDNYAFPIRRLSHF